MTRKSGIGVGILGISPGLPDQIRTNEFWNADFQENHTERAAKDLTTQADQQHRSSRIDPEISMDDSRNVGVADSGALSLAHRPYFGAPGSVAWLVLMRHP